jgi:hypothetical protein
MKTIASLLLVLASGLAMSQNINAFTDVLGRLYQFNDGTFQQIYYQRNLGFFIGKSYVAYVDSKGDVYVQAGAEKVQIAQTYNDIHVTDNLLLVKTNNVLRIWDRGERTVLTSNAITYSYGDSIVLFQDAVGRYLKYYWNGEIHEVAMVVGNYPLYTREVGRNVFIYKDNSGNNSIFWRGQFYDLFSSNQEAVFSCGQDVAAFNDPRNLTFTVFDNGYVIDAEPQHALNFQCGINFIYYKDASETHKVYKEEKKWELGFDLQNVAVRDSMVVFQDVGITKLWYNEEIYTIFNSKIDSYQVDGGIMAWTNQWGGVSAFVRGKQMEITRSKVMEFTLSGNTIVMKMGPSSYIVWWNGKMIDFTS